jgi:transposase-like protein
MTVTNSTPLMARAQNGDVTDDTDPAARPTRRIFTPEEKLAILTAYEEATEPGAKGAYLRKAGIYSSQITEWRRARDAGSLNEPPHGVRRVDKKKADRLKRETAQLKRRNERLEAELAKTRTVLDIMGKVHALLEDISKSADTEEQQNKRSTTTTPSGPEPSGPGGPVSWPAGPGPPTTDGAGHRDVDRRAPDLSRPTP